MIRYEMRGDNLSGLADEALSELRQRAEPKVLQSLLHLTGAAKRMLSRPGRGRIYVKGRVTHQASAPGDAPAVDTGRLRASITHDGPHVTGDTIRGEWGTNVEYAAALEYGTRHIAPRPYMRPAEEAEQSAVDAILGDL
jgi:HK97 gp10 family phage protein